MLLFLEVRSIVSHKERKVNRLSWKNAGRGPKAGIEARKRSSAGLLSQPLLNNSSIFESSLTTTYGPASSTYSGLILSSITLITLAIFTPRTSDSSFRQAPPLGSSYGPRKILRANFSPNRASSLSY
uniref:Uncharacterized protein n=1 Tax=Knipowitschia caucasica TaxID=637954 RepID=A0AAV2K148_KNICA